MEEPPLPQLYSDSVKDGIVIYSLGKGVFVVSRELFPTICTMDQFGMLWPYFLTHKVYDKKHGTYQVKIDEVPSWKPKFTWDGKRL